MNDANVAVLITLTIINLAEQTSVVQLMLPCAECSVRCDIVLLQQPTRGWTHIQDHVAATAHAGQVHSEQLFSRV